MRTIVIEGAEYVVLRGDPEKVMADPRFDSLAVMRVEGDEAQISEVQWFADEQCWWSYPDSTTTAPVAALREAVAPQLAPLRAWLDLRKRYLATVDRPMQEGDAQLGVDMERALGVLERALGEEILARCPR